MLTLSALMLMQSVDLSSACSAIYMGYEPIAPIDGCAATLDGDHQHSQMYGCTEDGEPEMREYEGAGCMEGEDMGNATALGDMYSCVTSGSACTFETMTVYTDDGETCGETYAQDWTVLDYCINTTTTYSVSSKMNKCIGSGIEGYTSVFDTYYGTDDCTDAPTMAPVPTAAYTLSPTPAPVPTAATTAYPTSLDCTEYAVCDGSSGANTLYLGLVPMVLMALALFK